MHDFGEIGLATRVEAEEAISRLESLIERYGSASVADLYGMIDVTAAFTDDKWGWEDLRGAGVRRSRGQYVLVLPKPEPLN